MLKNIDPCISPELIKILMEMGHGDEIVIADGNFPAASHTLNLVRLDGVDNKTILEAILKLFPLDEYVEHSIVLMMHGEEVSKPEIWDVYQNLVEQQSQTFSPTYLERHEFYKRAKNAYAIIATSESALYANIILKKGVIVLDDRGVENASTGKT